MGRKSREHRQAVVEGGQPFVNDFKRSQRYHCGKCGDSVMEDYVTEHLLKCQPDGAICEKCKKKIPAAEFVEHSKACRGNDLADVSKKGAKHE